MFVKERMDLLHLVPQEAVRQIRLNYMERNAQLLQRLRDEGMLVVKIPREKKSANCCSCQGQGDISVDAGKRDISQWRSENELAL